MFKGRIILLLAIMLVASVASAAMFKFPITSATAEGTVVLAGGGAADGTIAATTGALAAEAIGIIVEVEAGEILVANSGMCDNYSAVTTAGALLTYDGSGGLIAYVEGTPTPVVAIVVSAATMMITMKGDEAQQTHYIYTDRTTTEAGFLGVDGSSPDDVQEAIDLISGFLEGISATLFMTNAATDVDILGGTDVALVSVTHTGTSAVPDVANLDEMFVTFNGEFVDDQDNNGAVISINFVDGNGDLGVARQIYLLDRDFYQKQVVHMEHYYVADASTGNVFSVVADGNAVYDSGRMVAGAITVERF